MQRGPVLIVEDDKDILETLRQLLELEGYRVSTATNGKEAFERLANEEHPRLILLDLMMPVMNGWEFLAAKEKNEAFSSIPVLVVSAGGNVPVPASASGFIKKPVELDVLLDAVNKYC